MHARGGGRRPQSARIGGFTIYGDPTDFAKTKKTLETLGVKLESAEFTYVPTLTVPVDATGARKVIGLLEELEDNDDVQNAYANFEMSEEALKELKEATQ